MARAETAPLRRGWTTGACAAAAARAAFAALLTGRFPDPVTIRLPRGEMPSFPLALAELGEGRARAKANGQSLGRKPKLTPHQQHEAIQRRDQGESIRSIARSYNVNPSTISRLTA